MNAIQSPAPGATAAFGADPASPHARDARKAVDAVSIPEAFAALLAGMLGTAPTPAETRGAAAAEAGEAGESDAAPGGEGAITAKPLPETADLGAVTRQPLPVDSAAPPVTRQPLPASPIPMPLPPAERLSPNAPSAAPLPLTQPLTAQPAVAAGIDVRRTERRIDLVDPELRVRVERVVDRMRDEHGHRVEVVETLRHQARQNFLFEQGRSRPGPVVTWTRASNHTEGRAVDVIIDGSYGNPAAYAKLGRIASEEGLRTLGSRDPGHLELPAGVGKGAPAFAAAGPAPRSAGTAGAAGAAGESSAASRTAALGIAAVAQVAAVAAPQAAVVAAQPAAVAAVAQVAVPGAGGASAKARREAREDGSPVVAEAAPVERARAATPIFAVAEALRGGLGAEPGATGSTSGLGAGAAARLAHLLDMQSAAPLRPLQHVVLRIDGPAGQDRIRLDLRGSSLNASIALSDPAAVDRLNARVGDLQRSLGQQGIEAESLRVRSVKARTDTVEVTRAAAGLAAESELQRVAARAATEPNTARERSAHPQHQEPREGSPDSRQRSRKGPRGEQTP